MAISNPISISFVFPPLYFSTALFILFALWQSTFRWSSHNWQSLRLLWLPSFSFSQNMHLTLLLSHRQDILPSTINQSNTHTSTHVNWRYQFDCDKTSRNAVVVEKVSFSTTSFYYSVSLFMNRTTNTPTHTLLLLLLLLPAKKRNPNGGDGGGDRSFVRSIDWFPSSASSSTTTTTTTIQLDEDPCTISCTNLRRLAAWLPASCLPLNTEQTTNAHTTLAFFPLYPPRHKIEEKTVKLCGL